MYRCILIYLNTFNQGGDDPKILVKLDLTIDLMKSFDVQCYKKKVQKHLSTKVPLVLSPFEPLPGVQGFASRIPAGQCHRRSAKSGWLEN